MSWTRVTRWPGSPPPGADLTWRLVTEAGPWEVLPVWPVSQLEVDDHPAVVLPAGAPQPALAAPRHVQLPHAVIGSLKWDVSSIPVSMSVDSSTKSHHLGPVKQLDLDVSELPGVPHIVWPVLAALHQTPHPRVAGLYAAGEHHHHSHLELPEHRPEGGAGVRAGALGSDVHPRALREHVSHERSVYVVAGLNVACDLVSGGQ